MSELATSAPPEPEWAAFVAIDWADRKNFWRLLSAGSQRFETGELDNTPEAVEVWAAGLEQRFGGRKPLHEPSPRAVVKRANSMRGLRLPFIGPPGH